MTGAVARRAGVLRRRVLAALRRTDRRRWARSAELSADWDARTATLMSWAPTHGVVVDVGAGAQAARGMVAAAVRYLPVDVVARTPDTVVCDLNDPTLPELTGDFVLASGVVEYARDPRRLIAWFASLAIGGAMSYATTDLTPDRAARRAHGWLNDLSEEQLVRLLADAGLGVERREQWREQVLLEFRRRPAADGSTTRLPP